MQLISIIKVVSSGNWNWLIVLILSTKHIFIWSTQLYTCCQGKKPSNKAKNNVIFVTGFWKISPYVTFYNSNIYNQNEEWELPINLKVVTMCISHVELPENNWKYFKKFCNPFAVVTINWFSKIGSHLQHHLPFTTKHLWSTTLLVSINGKSFAVATYHQYNIMLYCPTPNLWEKYLHFSIIVNPQNQWKLVPIT